MLIKRPYRAGDTVKVKSINPPVYSLPDGLPDCATVKVIERGVGYDRVEYGGQVFSVSMVLIDSGHFDDRR
jgi:hypothetical protein